MIVMRDFTCKKNIKVWIESVNSDGEQIHQYQQIYLKRGLEQHTRFIRSVDTRFQ